MSRLNRLVSLIILTAICITIIPSGLSAQSEEAGAIADSASQIISNDGVAPPKNVIFGESGSAMLTLTPEADANTQDGSARQNNYGASSTLQVRLDNYRIIYIRFNLGEQPLTANSAKLRLYKSSSSAATLNVAVAATNDWIEGNKNGSPADPGEICSGNKPSYSAPIATVAVPAAAGYVEFDVTSAVTPLVAQSGSKAITLVILGDGSASTTNLSFNSKEASTNRPQLVIDAVYTPVPSTVAVTAPSYGIVPAAGVQSYMLSATVLDQYGTLMQGCPLTWNVYDKDRLQPAGISVDSNGLLTIDSTAVAGRDITVEVSCQGVIGSKTIKLAAYNPHEAKFSPEADATVQGGSMATKNFGGDIKLQCRLDGYRRSFLRFNLQSITGAVEKAKLRLYKTDTYGGSIKVAVASTNNWIEGASKGDIDAANGEICDNNKPAQGTAISETALNPVSGWVELDVTSAVQTLADSSQNGDKLITLVVYNDLPAGGISNNNITFNSREAASNRPELVVDAHYVAQPTKLVFNVAGKAIIPDASEQDCAAQVSGVVKDQMGLDISDSIIQWSVTDANGDIAAGVSVNLDKLTITKDATPGKIILKAAVQGHIFTKEIVLITNSDAIALAQSLLDIGNLDLVTKDLNLVTAFAIPDTIGQPVNISWFSDREDLITADGHVNRPPVTEPNKKTPVNLTAVFSKGLQSAQKTYVALIARMGKTVVIKPDMAGFLYRTTFTPWQYQMKNGMRYTYLRFDLSSFIAQGMPISDIASANIRLGGNCQDYIEANYISDDSWADPYINISESTAPTSDQTSPTPDTPLPTPTPIPFTAPALGKKIADGYYYVENSNKYVQLDVLNSLKQDLSNTDSKLSVRISVPDSKPGITVKYANPVLVLEMIYDQVPAKINISQKYYYDPAVRIPTEGTEPREYVASTVDQYGAYIDGDSYTYSIVGSPAGVTINDDGKLLVSSDASPGQIQFKVSSRLNPDLSVTQTVDILPKMYVQRPALVLTDQEVCDLKNKIIGSPQFLEALKAETTNAESVSERAEKMFEWGGWNTTTSVSSFTAPQGAVMARFGFMLEGKGKVIIDDFTVQDVGKEKVYLHNGDFETGTDRPDSWSSEVLYGNPAFRWENSDIQPWLANSGKRSVSIENKDSNSAGEWISSPVEVIAGDSYFISAYYSQKELLERGYRFVARFYDKDGNEMTDSEYDSELLNWVTPLRRQGYDAPMMSCILLYYLNGDAKYLDRLKKLLQYVCWEMRFQMERRDSNSEAVHIGRWGPSIAAAYDILKGKGMLTQEEDMKLRSDIYWIVDTLDDKNFFDYTVDNNKYHNYNADRCSGMGCIALAFPEYSKSAVILQHAIDNWEAMKNGNQANGVGGIGDDGSWPEVLRYQQAVFNVFVQFAYMLKRAKGIDLFADKKMQDFLLYPANIQGPRDTVSVTNPNRAVFPGIGDSTWFEGMNILGRAAWVLKDINPEYSQALMYAWSRSGYYNVSGNLSAFFATDYDLPIKRPNLKSRYFQDIGYVLFRQNYGLPNEYYFNMVVHPTRLASHQNSDRGSFQIWAKSTPLVIEAGVGPYDASGTFFDSADAHNILQFIDANGTKLGSATEATIKCEDFKATPSVDYTRTYLPRTKASTDPATGKVTVTEIYERYRRNAAFVKNGFDIYVIWDDLTYDGQTDPKSVFTYHTLSKNVDVKGNKITAQCFNDMQLETIFMQPSSINPKMEFQLVAPEYPKINGQNQIQSISVEGASNQDYLVAFYPKGNSEGGLTTSELQTGNSNVKAFRLQKPDGKWFIIVKNSSESSAAATLNLSESLCDMMTDSIYAASGGKVEMSVDAKTILFLRPVSLPAPMPKSIKMDGVKFAGVPSSGQKTYLNNAWIIDNYGNSMEYRTLNWSIVNPVEGVSIDSASGDLTVYAGAPVGATVNIQAQVSDSPGVTAILPVKLIGDAVPCSVQIVGAAEAAIPAEGVNTIAYTAQFKDQYGSILQGQNADWYLNKQVQGVSLDAKNGVLEISSSAAEGETVELTAASSSKQNVTGSILITLSRQRPSSIRISGAAEIGLPRSGIKQQQLTAAVLDQSGGSMAGQEVVWSLDNPPSGVSISKDGMLSVSSGVSDGTLITATVSLANDPSINSQYNIVLKAKIESAVKVSGNNKITIPINGSETFSYEAQVLDQNGGIMDNAPVQWSVDFNPYGVYVDENGTVTVRSGAAAGNIILRASVSNKPDISGAIVIELAKAKNAGGDSKPVTGGFTPIGGGGGQNVAPVQTTPPAPKTWFNDLDTVPWAAEAINSLSEKGVINGLGNGIFAPMKKVTRAQFATMLVKAFNLVRNDAVAEFTDVPQGQWYYIYVASAAQCGIISGTGDGSFRPESEITRQELAAMVYRAAKAAGIKLNNTQAQDFTDMGEIADYAVEAVQALKGAGIVNGMEGGRFAPAEYTTRAQAATIIYRLVREER